MNGHDRPQMFVGKQLPGGWLVGGNVPADNVLGPVILLVLSPFVAAHWVVDRYGWGGLVAVLAALGATAWFLVRTRPGRVVAGAILGFAAGFLLAFVGGGLLVVLWSVAGAYLEVPR